MKEKISERSIQRILAKQYRTNPQYITENLFVFKWESDFLIKTRSGYWHEVEIKISLADFKNDAKHKREKFEILEKGEYTHRGQLFKENNRPNYFSYCVTENMVEDVLPLIPDYAGLYFVNEKKNRLDNVKAPQIIHKTKIDDNDLNLTRKFYYNYRSWKSSCDQWDKERKDLMYKIRLLKDEYKAVAGCNISDAL